MPDRLTKYIHALASLALRYPILSTAAGAALAFIFRSWIEALLRQFGRPFGWMGRRIYAWIAPRNPFSISLRKYKQALARSHLAFLENPVGPSLAVPLEKAFAPLKLVSTERREVDLFTFASTSDRFIVIGGPGTGKTTLMKSLVMSVLRKRSRFQNLNRLIPVFVTLRSLASKSYTVEEAIVASMGEHHFPGAESFVNSALDDGRLLIILDGLDEVGLNRPAVANEIQAFCFKDQERPTKNKVIVTCREASYRTRDLRGAVSEIVHVEPFGNSHMRTFLMGWPLHRGKSALPLFAQIQNDPQIKEVCRNPLLLTILTGLYLEADRFELPTSRDSFYHAAINELMTERPERRHIEQLYWPEKKLRLLENVALQRLQTVVGTEDPEEFFRPIIQRSISEVFGDEKVDAEMLLRELVEVNGIVKISSDDSFTFPHRTIQEYLAAKECCRSMLTDQLLILVRERPELLEVLHCYCGIIKNVPQLNSVLSHFLEGSQVLEAARCLSNMTEIPASDLLVRIESELLKLVKSQDDPEAPLMLLSSLSMRQAAAFRLFRTALMQGIQNLTASGKLRGISALEGALATSPDLAMGIIPVLLSSSDSFQRRTALNLLRDIATEESLDQLVQLLNSPRKQVRAEAALVISGMMGARNAELRSRAVLLPEHQEDPAIWPIGRLFPSRVALPMAQALAETDLDVQSLAMRCAVAALKVRYHSELAKDPFPQRVQKYWPRLERDLRAKAVAESLFRCCLIIQLIAYLPGATFSFKVLPAVLKSAEPTGHPYFASWSIVFGSTFLLFWWLIYPLRTFLSKFNEETRELIATLFMGLSTRVYEFAPDDLLSFMLKRSLTVALFYVITAVIHSRALLFSVGSICGFIGVLAGLVAMVVAAAPVPNPFEVAIEEVMPKDDSKRPLSTSMYAKAPTRSAAT